MAFYQPKQAALNKTDTTTHRPTKWQTSLIFTGQLVFPTFWLAKIPMPRSDYHSQKTKWLKNLGWQ